MSQIYQDHQGKLYTLSKTGKKHYQQNCQHCQGAFFPSRAGQKYCSHSCNVRAYQIRKKASTPELKLPQSNQSDSFKPSKQGITNAAIGSIAGNAIYDLGKGLAQKVSKPKIEKDIAEIKSMLANSNQLGTQLSTTQVQFQAKSGGKLITFQEVLLGDQKLYDIIKIEDDLDYLSL